MKKNTIRQFNIRVYGLIINDKKEVLISDEFQINMKMTKFPGGGLDFGEGPEDCIRRECLEELGQEVEIIDHFYTTHFFQQALFYPDQQLISIYYRIRIKDAIKFKISEKAFDFAEMKNGNQSFRWLSIDKLSADEFTFPIDRYVANLLKEKFS